ncbi:UDP-N-acetylmuramoyl-L-alanine--D-glutamate ligase [Ammoniphilus sp. CFH 90114]|uniref:UDP-N-acetylmuramoyl-L-alanine--D-glutamate ligase n=1 Tax=Ammoniphilus sp. CFH 90114 TaxID=2493665 RepID=UPI00100DF74E|nr:UDP-N-acetylmuramoyl-L-alanine--D-glutamate ligase [Ammoniphilus sp. CFH 90114]RXT15004.1 UDP-N-acetylmuramoyl-L-alanine--D-glutamate ligase [Ammoniphilus sp. CFH 90114]
MTKHYDKEWLQGKNIIVLGLAKSGLAVSKLLVAAGAHVIVNDQKPEEELVGVEELKKLGIPIIAGYHPDDLIHTGVDLIVKNPGIPYTSAPVQSAIALDIPVITEIELAHDWSRAPIVGITGSNGKTTTTTLVGLILEAAGKDPIVAGNIGTVLCEQAGTARPEQIMVAELSSFQLKGTIHFRPAIGCLLNITPAHLDYHQTWDDYIKSKGRLFVNMKEQDIAVFNADNSGCLEVADKVQCQKYWFSRLMEVDQGCFVKNDAIYYRGEDGLEEEIIQIGQIGIPGAHNLENALASTVICKSLGVKADTIREVLTHFKGVEHRLEFVAEIDGVKYYNNSKATNSEATLKALESFRSPIVLIAGGLDRGFDFVELIPSVKKGVKGIVAYGQTKEKFISIGERAGLKLLTAVDNVNEAVIQASRMADSGDIVLLSPACASWDMYQSFEERGSIFKESVHKLRTSLH